MESVAAVWSAVSSSGVLSAVSSVASLLSGLSQQSSANQQAGLYESQAQQSRLQSRGEAVKYEQQANSIARRALEANAMARARAAAGGIDPFSGSAQFIQELTNRDSGEEIDLSRENAKLAALGGRAQERAFISAARSTRTRGLLSGVATMATGFGRSSTVGGPVGSRLIPEIVPGQFSLTNPAYG